MLAGTPLASFATLSHEHHRVRRGALNPFFSKMAVSRMEPLIQEKVARLCARLAEKHGTGEVVRLDVAYMALTMDIITHYAYGESVNYLAEDDFRLAWKEAVIGALGNGTVLRQFPWILPLMKLIPMSVLQIMDPQAAGLMEWGRVVAEKVKEMMQMHKTGNKPDGTIFQTLLDSDLPPEEKSAARLQDEGQSVVGAGSETTARTLTVISFYLLQDKAKLQRLREELGSLAHARGERNILSRLEQLPYLVRSGSLHSLFPFVETQLMPLQVCSHCRRASTQPWDHVPSSPHRSRTCSIPSMVNTTRGKTCFLLGASC